MIGWVLLDMATLGLFGGAAAPSDRSNGTTSSRWRVET
jgi:hypothetical protein